MKKKREGSNKLTLAILFLIPVVLVIVINVIALHPWDKYNHGGPIAYPPDKGSETKSPSVLPGTGVVFHSIDFSNGKTQPIQVLNIEPGDLTKNATFKALGLSDKKIDVLQDSDFKAHQSDYAIQKLPFVIPPKTGPYKMVFEVTPSKTGVYTLQGLTITYKWNNKLYQEYYPDTYVVKAVSNPEE